jgi:hypothetical protein
VVLEFWASNFPNRQPADFVFPSERYGAAGDDFKPCAYKTDPSKPIGRWKEDGKLHATVRACNAGFMTSVTRAALGCWKLEYRSLCSP